MSKSLKTIRLSLIFQTCFDGTSVIVSVTVKITSIWLHNIAITSVCVSNHKSLLKFYFKIPYIGRFSAIAQHRVRTLVNRFCKPVDNKLVFSTFKIKNLFNVKDPLPDRLRTRVVYKFSCASCNACYIGETSRHFATRVREHLSSDGSSHVFKHLQSSESCRISCSADCFTVLDSATTKFQVKLKESMYIKWEKPDLNQQVKHINLMLSL